MVGEEPKAEDDAPGDPDDSDDGPLSEDPNDEDDEDGADDELMLDGGCSDSIEPGSDTRLDDPTDTDGSDAGMLGADVIGSDELPNDANALSDEITVGVENGREVGSEGIVGTDIENGSDDSAVRDVSTGGSESESDTDTESGAENDVGTENGTEKVEGTDTEGKVIWGRDTDVIRDGGGDGRSVETVGSEKEGIDGIEGVESGGVVGAVVGEGSEIAGEVNVGIDGKDSEREIESGSDIEGKVISDDVELKSETKADEENGLDKDATEDESEVGRSEDEAQEDGGTSRETVVDGGREEEKDRGDEGARNDSEDTEVVALDPWGGREDRESRGRDGDVNERDGVGACVNVDRDPDLDVGDGEAEDISPDILPTEKPELASEDPCASAVDESDLERTDVGAGIDGTPGSAEDNNELVVRLFCTPDDSGEAVELSTLVADVNETVTGTPE
ncbi:hypothetical protein PsYK624_028490 [Phanerochaete sordida]|uniref:Uncharacterized protein n=1 Tax=Phanerochaete sordida TaxID=48140 RepID=A0A9P3G1X7_9APHY|nr:hypothetical protein PsYK624_028490 [Phanerochaete sordida]